MSIELIEIRDFLAKQHPFDLLPPDALDGLPSKIQTKYVRRGTVFIKAGEPCEFLHIVRTGALETHSPEGNLLARLSEGEACGVHAMLNKCVALNQVTAIEDSLLYLIHADEFNRLRDEYQQFAYFFAPLGAERLRDAQAHGGKGGDSGLDLMSYTARELLVRDPICISPDVTVQQAAAKMSEDGVSCLLVTEGEKLVGIFTDRDIRNRVVAKALPYDSLVRSVMTPDPVSLQADSFAFDAMLSMTRRNIRHMPIMDGGKVAGVVTSTNLMQQQTTSAIYMVGDIYKRKTFEGLAEVVSRLPKLLLHLVDAGASSHKVGHIITTISDAVTVRLLRMAQEKFGPAPVPFAWMASGSQAREEQTGVSDQDNFLIIDDSYDPVEHGDYFTKLANYVNDGLNACGYIYCPGDMMAKTDEWRQPLSVWKKYFTKWIDTPEPKALMLSCIFFDARFIAGTESLFTELQELIIEKSQKSGMFIGHMVGNALSHTPPLGFFKNFVLIRGGEHNHQFDLKHNGIVPIVDIARVYALENGIRAVNTYSRLMAQLEGGVLSESGARDLLDAYEFIGITRLRHQAEQIRAGEKPDNFMAPEGLSHFERSHLKDAFSVVKTIQQAMASSHGATHL